MKKLLSVLLLLAILAPVATALDDAGWAALKAAAKNRQRLLIYDNDGDDTMHKPENGGELTLERYLALRTSYLAGSQVDTMIFPSTYGAFDNMMAHPENFAEGFRKHIQGSYYEWLRGQGLDPVQVQLEFARKNNIEFFMSIRFNDTHDSFSPHMMTSGKLKHPEWLMGRADSLPPYGSWSAFDYTLPEVRELFLNTVRDTAERYAVDGLSIDLFRQPVIFRSVAYGGKASAAERQALLEMFRTIRQFTETVGRRRERPILILVRVPDDVRYCHDIGLDLEALLQEGLVDMVVPAGDWRLNPWSYSVELCHKYGVKCYADVDMPEYNEPTGRLMRNASEAHWAWQARALACGCDGTYWFNRFYASMVKVLALPDLASLKFKSKRYHATDRFLYYTPETPLCNGEGYMKMPFIHPLHPMELAVGKTYELPFEFGDDIDALLQEGSTFDVTGFVSGIIPEPEKLQIVSNGVAWPFTGKEGELATYNVPAGALKLGDNTLQVTYNGKPATASKEQIIMAGNELLKGVRQPPWRRIFPECAAAGAQAETIVNGAYRFADMGKGFANLVYPLPAVPEELHVRFTLKVESSDGGQGVVLRAADGRHVEIVRFTTNSVSLVYAGLSANFNTTAFHDYELTMDAGKVRLAADGKELLAAAPVVAIDGDERVVLKGASLYMPYGATRSLLVGSLDDAGKGVSLWKNVRINRLTGRVSLTDFAVETNIFRPLVRREARKWRANQQGGKALFFNSAPNWSSNPMIAEAEVNLDQGPVRLAFSRGGDFTVFEVAKDIISFPFDSVKPMSLKGLKGVQTLHVQFDDTDRAQLFCGDAGLEFNVKNTTMGLQEEYFAGLPQLDRSILRHGGFIVLPDGKGRRNEAAVKAVRSLLMLEGEGFPADKAKWQLTYEAADQDLPGNAWQSTYLAKNMEIVDGADDRLALRLTGSEMPQSQMFELADPKVINQWPGDELAFECRMRFAGGMPEGQEDFFTFGIGGGEGAATGTLYVQLGLKKLAGNCGTIPFEGLGDGKYFILQGVVDKKSCAARFWIDGELIGARPAVPNPVQAPFFQWGKTGANHGVVEIDYLKLGTI